MRNKHSPGRIWLLGAGAIALANLAACGPGSPADPALSQAPSQQPAPAASQAPATTEQAAAPPAPVDAPEVPPAPEPTTPPQDQDADVATPAAAENTVRRYYAAINAKDYASAYALWSNEGAASRQPFDVFANGYWNTTGMQATVGKAFDQEGAAGARYIQVPIDLTSQRQDGSTRHYRGTFTLRAVMADGATAQQRRWHLDSADLEGYEPTPTAQSPTR